MRSSPRVSFWLTLLMLSAALLPAPALGDEFPKGDGKLEVSVAGKTIEVFTYRPTNYTDGPLIVVFHGMLRNADTYRDNARSMGDKFKALIAAPLFETNRFPSRAYQRGNVIENGKVKPQAEWTYHLIPPLVDALRARAGRANMPYYFIGHSAGGQFLVRMTAMLPAGAMRVVAANPGAHIFPSRDLPFPYGFAELPNELGDDAALKRFLAQPLTLYLGTADVLEKELDMSPTAMKQGPTRIERGRTCFKLAQELATKRGWEFNWNVIEAEGIGQLRTRDVWRQMPDRTAQSQGVALEIGGSRGIAVIAELRDVDCSGFIAPHCGPVAALNSVKISVANRGNG
jgi:poly(3-hydroxybutyrate) depolymerase